MSKKIIVVGSLNMDLVVHSPRHPQPGETLLGNSFATFTGGKGANQAVAAARLGGDVAMVGHVGNDPYGKKLVEELQRSGVDTTWVLAEEHEPTGLALITVDEAGQNTIVVVPGANGKLTPQSLSQADALFESASILIVQLEISMATVEAAVRTAKSHGLQVVLNPAPAAALSPALLEMADYLVPNQSELALISGKEDFLDGIAQLHSRGARNILVTLGGQGAYFSGGGQTLHVPAFPVNVVDTTAAGDAFVGGFSVALAEGARLMDAIRWGTAAGGLAVTISGAQNSLPYRSDVETQLLRYAY